MNAPSASVRSSSTNVVSRSHAESTVRCLDSRLVACRAAWNRFSVTRSFQPELIRSSRSASVGLALPDSGLGSRTAVRVLLRGSNSSAGARVSGSRRGPQSRWRRGLSFNHSAGVRSVGVSLRGIPDGFPSSSKVTSVAWGLHGSQSVIMVSSSHGSGSVRTLTVSRASPVRHCPRGWMPLQSSQVSALRASDTAITPRRCGRASSGTLNPSRPAAIRGVSTLIGRGADRDSGSISGERGTAVIARSEGSIPAHGVCVAFRGCVAMVDPRTVGVPRSLVLPSTDPPSARRRPSATRGRGRWRSAA